LIGAPRAVALAALALLVPAAVCARQAPPELVVSAPERLAAAAERVRGYDRSRLRTAMRLAGLDEPGPPIRVVLAEEGSEAARAVPPWVAGYARGHDGLVVLFPARAPTYPDDSLEELLHHEVCHVLIARAARGWPVPRWFNEGVAMAAGRAWTLGDTTRYAFEVLRRGRVRLADLDRLFAGGGGAAARAYAVAGAFVRDLEGRHGPTVTGEILRRVGGGAPFAGAFHAATGSTLAAAEEAFWRRETFWRRWVPFLTSSVVVWIAVTLLALVAFRRRRERDAAIARRWEAEERAAAGPPRWDTSAPGGGEDVAGGGPPVN
jgi:hypothetical protein